MFNVNVKSIYHSVNACVPQFIKQEHTASIVNIASIGSFRPRPGLVWYNSSKGAVSNVSNLSSRPRLTLDADEIVLVHQRSGGRVRSSPGQMQCHLPTVVRYGSLRDVCRRERHT